MVIMKTVVVILIICAVSVFLTVSACSDSQTVHSRGGGEQDAHVAWNTVTVTATTVNLRSGPGTEYSILGQVSAGDSLQVTGGLEDWYRIYIPHMSLFAWIYGPLTSGTELP